MPKEICLKIKDNTLFLSMPQIMDTQIKMNTILAKTAKISSVMYIRHPNNMFIYQPLGYDNHFRENRNRTQ